MGAPSTPILDNFSGTLAAWTQNAYGGTSAFTITSNQLTSTAGGKMYWTAPFTAGDLECYMTLVNGPHNGQEAQLLLSNSASTLQGYSLLVDSAGGNSVIRRWTDSFTQTTIAGPFSQAMSSGDKIAVQRIGTAVNAWVFTGGAWSLYLTATDATYSNTQYLGISTFDTVNIYDDFGGGIPVATTGPVISPFLFPPQVAGRGAC